MSRPDPEPADPLFEAPWQAQAFALAYALRDAGVIDAEEWAEALGAMCATAGADPAGRDYYDHWLAALENLVVAKSLAGTGELDELTRAWERAARATPHGQILSLSNDPGPAT